MIWSSEALCERACCSRWTLSDSMDSFQPGSGWVRVRHEEQQIRVGAGLLLSAVDSVPPGSEPIADRTR